MSQTNNIQQLRELSKGKTRDTMWWKVIQGSTGHYRIARCTPKPEGEGLGRHLEKSAPGAGC